MRLCPLCQEVMAHNEYTGIISCPKCGFLQIIAKKKAIYKET